MKETFAPALPQGRLKNALIAGVIAGILCTAQSIAITLVNASTYQAYDTAKQATIKNALALTIAGYGALTFIISMLILLVAGFIIGKVSVQRRLGFLTGFVAGSINYAGSFVTRQIPSYPGNHYVAGVILSDILVSLVFLVIWGIIGGLVSLLGAWIASRRDPYYVGY
ncbi:MAG TPA: hypothetical protein VKP04_02470 [Ktedonobacteraceae bacterium]|nr:hypothetical protein [Ktedonobacteraceae bacterium]